MKAERASRVLWPTQSMSPGKFTGGSVSDYMRSSIAEEVADVRVAGRLMNQAARKSSRGDSRPRAVAGSMDRHPLYKLRSFL